MWEINYKSYFEIISFEKKEEIKDCLNRQINMYMKWNLIKDELIEIIFNYFFDEWTYSIIKK